MRKIAKVVMSLSLDKEFDYFFSDKLDVRKGMRVLVDFNGKKRLGLVVKITEISEVKNIKPILNVLDARCLLGEDHISFASRLSEMYPYPKGEFLFMMLPGYLKKIKKIDWNEDINTRRSTESSQKVFIKARYFQERYRIWKNIVKEKLREGSVLICFPQLSYLLKAKQILEKDFPHEICVLHSQEKEKELFLNWKKTRTNALILGTRVSIFYHPYDLKLLVMEEENSPYYSQEEKPFYHFLEVALILSDIKKTDLILSGDFPSLAAYKLIKDKEVLLNNNDNTESKSDIVDMSEFSKKQLIGPVLIELLRKTVQENKKAVVLWNKQGFSRIISCSSCGYTFKCAHCSGFLQFTLATESKGICPFCHKIASLPKICGQCNKGYLKAAGYGIKRIKYVLKKIFPEFKIEDWQDRGQYSQIILSTSKIISYLYESEIFNAGFILDIDLFLARPEYDATFNAYLYLKKLSHFFKDKLYVFTNNRKYYLFHYINKPWENFYEAELNFRKELLLPPFGLVSKITLRSKDKNRLLKRAEGLYNRFEKRHLEVYGPLEEQPFKLRDKFRYSVIVKTKRDFMSRRIIKEEIKGIRSSSIQIAVCLR